MPDSVTFRAQRCDVAADQKEPVGRTMGNVTAAASFHLLVEVFINPGASLLGMALETGLIFDHVACPSKARPFTAPVGGVAIRAFDCPLEHLVRVGQVEGRFDIHVAGETEVNLFFLQKFFPDGFPVDLVAIVAPDGCYLMDRPSELGEGFLFFVASEAGLGPLLG